MRFFFCFVFFNLDVSELDPALGGEQGNVDRDAGRETGTNKTSTVI